MKIKTALASLALLSMSGAAYAQEAGTWALSVGAANVDPKSDNGALNDGTEIRAGDNIRPTITAEYFIKDNLGIEVLAAVPFKHDVNVPGAGEVAEIKHLPPTVTLQYHFGDNNNAIRPFVGAGLNYTLFFDESTSGILTDVDLDLKNTFGLSARAGLDFRLNENFKLRADVRWIDISPDVELAGADVGSIDIDPLVYGLSVVRQF